MTTGPLEYLVIEFEGNHFTGEILPELRALRDKGLIRVVDLLFIQKDQNGIVTVRELSDLSEEEAKPYGPIAGDLAGLFADEDVETLGSDIPNNSSVAALLIEHTWAIHLKETILNASGRILSAGMVRAAEVETLGPELTAEQAASPM